MLNYPVQVILLVTLGIGLYAGIQKLAGPPILLLGFVLAIVLPWLYWSIMVTKWRLWAFDRVRNVHELQKRAVQERLIWKEGSFWEKTEIRTASDKAKWASLQKKFLQSDEYIDDPIIPEETLIYYSTQKSMLSLIFMLLWFGGGLYFFLIEESFFLGIILCAFGAASAYSDFKKITNKKPQIILNALGMQTAGTNFYAWSAIKNETVIEEDAEGGPNYFLTFDHPNGTEKIAIDHLDISWQEVEKRIRVYRVRSVEKQ